jgi:hypothetical protein
VNAAEVHRDERTVAVENASYRWAYVIQSFGILAAVAYRSFALDEAAWDLLFLVVVAGATGTAYQAFHRTLTRPWLVTVILTAAIAAGVAAVAALR